MAPTVEFTYPMSPVQEGLLYESLRSSGLGEYVEQLNWFMHGPLHLDRFRAAWERAARRLDTMRTACSLDQGEPLQSVYLGVAPDVHVIDWRGLPEEKWAGELADFLEADRLRGFQLEKPPLMRITLIRLTDDIHFFLWSLHHLISDGWSATVTLREVFSEYAAPTVSKPGPPAYKTFVDWVGRQDWAAIESF